MELMSTHQSNDRDDLRFNARLGAKNGPPEIHVAAALMTATGLEELRSELEQLRQRHSRDITQQLREARWYGHDSNNDEYHAVREEQMVLEARARLLEDAVARAVVVDPEEADHGVVAIGATVSIEDLNSRGKSRRYRIANAHSTGANVISAASPMGQALMGAAPGTVVTADLPHGRSRSVRVIAVEASRAAL